MIHFLKENIHLIKILDKELEARKERMAKRPSRTIRRPIEVFHVTSFACEKRYQIRFSDFSVVTTMVPPKPLLEDYDRFLELQLERMAALNLVDPLTVESQQIPSEDSDDDEYRP